ncbi:ATP-binding cassette domain-containing protein [Streptococcus ovuberis]|uniref:ABC-F family ATP-binding cassette domain-containing protein n=1 Tax=Streptococcus ovuberis TaxID=1936207 RepID=A0A7X6MYX5_9STRE|nr:ATP-binding cassette domain-containing protein [Streptococcus ovuberis]NKZ20995.1 ABC-F family ATP-binding cassette domain-containing protein [Streptococcus ovuberis]
MLKLQAITITHLKDLQTLIADLDLAVNPGDKLAIIGEEGTGKSTLIQAILDPEQISSYAQLDGQIINHFTQIGYLPQNLLPQQLNQTVSDFIYTDLDYTVFDFQIFWTMADRFNLPIERFEEQKLRLANLSGGEKIKLQLLKLLATDPDLLILDEPSGDLDMETLVWLESFIQESEKTILFISHDEALLSRSATSILHLELLQKRREPRWTFYKGDYESYKTDRQRQFDKDLQVASKQREEQTKRLTKNQRIQKSVEHQLRNTKNDVAGRLLAKKMKSLQSQEKRFERESKDFTDIPQDMDRINLFFSGVEPLPASKILLDWQDRTLSTGQTINLILRGQDRLAVIGQNGIGKTRLLTAIKSELSQREGISLGYMPQDYHQVLPIGISALDFLKDSTTAEQARTLLARLQLTREEIHHSAHQLSGGQKAKICLAKMVLEKANVLLLDEPTRHLSPTSQEEFKQLLQTYSGAIVLVTHDRSVLQAIKWEVLEMKENDREDK